MTPCTVMSGQPSQDHPHGYPRPPLSRASNAHCSFSRTGMQALLAPLVQLSASSLCRKQYAAGDWVCLMLAHHPSFYYCLAIDPASAGPAPTLEAGKVWGRVTGGTRGRKSREKVTPDPLIVYVSHTAHLVIDENRMCPREELVKYFLNKHILFPE